MPAISVGCVANAIYLQYCQYIPPLLKVVNDVLGAARFIGGGLRFGLGSSYVKNHPKFLALPGMTKDQYTRLSMKHINEWALNLAKVRGASYADARIADDRSRALATKNGKLGGAADS